MTPTAPRPDLARTTSADAITLDALARAIADLHAKVDRLLSRRALTLRRGDRAQLEKILPAVAGAIGSTEFLARELPAHASAAVRLVVRGLSVKALGRLLARAEGVPIDGFVVQRVGVEVNVAIWKIVRC